MATTSIWKISAKLNGVINYATNEAKTKIDNESIEYSDLHKTIEYAKSDYKTEQQFYVSGINCSPGTAYEEMQNTKEFYDKKDGILGFHAFQSFNEGEVTPELAHKIGIELAKAVWGDRFEVVVSTHLNTNHIHNHFILNSVSFVDGKKFYSGRYTNAFIRHMNDEICSEYGLSVLDEKTCKSGINYNNYYKKYLNKNGYRKTAKNDVDYAIKEAYTYTEFLELLSNMGYQYYERYGRLSILKPNRQPIRLEKSFGDLYSINFIKKRIIEEQPIKKPFIDSNVLRKNSYSYYIPVLKLNKKSHIKIKGFLAIYFHYYYLFQKYRNDRTYTRITPKMRAEINRMNLYSEEAKFLSRNKINNSEDLRNYKFKLYKQINDICSDREIKWRERDSTNNENAKYEICKTIETYNNKIKLLREEVTICEDIQTRIPKMKEELNKLKLQKTNEKKLEEITKEEIEKKTKEQEEKDFK